MELFACGINYNTASSLIREKFILSSDMIFDSLTNLKLHNGIKEAVILSTCLRTELYCFADNKMTLLNWFKIYFDVSDVTISNHFFCEDGDAAVAHILRVASGLDSMFMGETQIIGQMKRAYLSACQHRISGPNIKTLFSFIFSGVKIIRTNTSIGVHNISINSIATSLAKSIFTDISDCVVMVIGSGETAKIMAKYFYHCGTKKILILNRTLSKAQFIADKFAAFAAPISQLPTYINNADIIITATSSNIPIITTKMLQQLIDKPRTRPILLIDLGIPKNIAMVDNLSKDIFLYTLDNLAQLSQDNICRRMNASSDANQLILSIINDYTKQKHLLSSKKFICDFREHFEEIMKNESHKAKKLLESGHNAHTVIINWPLL